MPVGSVLERQLLHLLVAFHSNTNKVAQGWLVIFVGIIVLEVLYWALVAEVDSRKKNCSTIIVSNVLSCSKFYENSRSTAIREL